MDRLTCDRMFAAVVEKGSFTEAAAQIGTSSGQASKLVSRLEKELGVRLLNRTTRALSATEAGRAYCERLRTILDDFDALDAAARDASDEPGGKVRLTAPLTFGTTRLAPLLVAFAEAHARIALEVQFSDRLVNLVDEGFDLAVRVGKPADSSLIARKLCEARVMCVAAPAHIAARGRPARPEDLASHDCIIDLNLRDPHHWPFRGGQRVPVKGRLAFSNAGACLTAVEAGLGIAFSPDFVAAEALAEGRVEQVLAEFEDEPLAVYTLYPSGRHLAAKVRVLVDFLAEGLRSRG